MGRLALGERFPCLPVTDESPLWPEGVHRGTVRGLWLLVMQRMDLRRGGALA